MLRKSDTIEAHVHIRSNTLSRSKNGVQVVQLKYFEETISWIAHLTTDWSAESITNGVMDGGVFMNMLPKHHIYVVQGYSIYVCIMKFNNIYMLLIHIYVLLNIYVV